MNSGLYRLSADLRSELALLQAATPVGLRMASTLRSAKARYST